MQYAVPQFVDVESKIIGPVSVRQFVMLAIALVGVFLFYKFADFSLFIFATVIILIFTAIIAFVKVNGRPFHFFLLNVLQSVKIPHLRVWRKEARAIPVVRKTGKKKTDNQEVQVNYIKIAQKKAKARSRISDLSLLVDTGGYYAQAEK